MYFPIGWPKVLKRDVFDVSPIRHVNCNRDRVLFSILTENSLCIWFCKPSVPIVAYNRILESLEDIGTNVRAEWRPDSSGIVVLVNDAYIVNTTQTSEGYLMFYKLVVDDTVKTLYELVDSPNPNLRRDSAELFIKESVPCLDLNLEYELNIADGISNIACIRDELMIATKGSFILRYKWNGTANRDYCLDLRRIPFCLDKQVSKAVPIFERNKCVVEMDYSPLVGGFAIVFNDGKAAFLTASSLKFDPNQVQGIWAPNVEDATVTSVNHKYRLIAFGLASSKGVIYTIDEQTGGLEVSHHLIVSTQVYPGELGAVGCLKWTPDYCALAMSWTTGGFSIWSAFGSLLVCSLGWNYGLHVDLTKSNPFLVSTMEWSVEGYQLWMANENGQQERRGEDEEREGGNFVAKTELYQLEFLKSSLTANPGMSHESHLLLQGTDKLYVNLGSGGLSKSYHVTKVADNNHHTADKVTVTSSLVESKQWLVVPLPASYLTSNWPVRYCAVGGDGKYLAVAGRSGLAHYSMITHRWKLFGNESQEKNMIVTGGLLWWKSYVVAGVYSLPDDRDEIRLYPREPRLSNTFMSFAPLGSQILLMDVLWDKLVAFCADGRLFMYELSVTGDIDEGPSADVRCLRMIDISALCIHPTCVISVTLTALKLEQPTTEEEEVNSFVLNISGRLLLVNQREMSPQGSNNIATPVLLASCVENVWVPHKLKRRKQHLTEALWLFCGAHGMRVWLPLFPKDGRNSHTYMSKRIMLPFKLKIYPLAILFEEAILLGAENDTTLYSSNPTSVFSLPFNTLERTSQVYLHQILRQLIRRNLGYHAWEVARSCETLPYFPHSLELLLHEVLEEEATSKEPIPDAQLPSVVEFIHEFPVYLQTVVQCARKTEIALWPYLFSAAGKPKDLFKKCLMENRLDTAASYLIILQNLESSVASRQYASLLLDATVEDGKWELSKDLVRFFRAIDPSDDDACRMNAPQKLSFILQSQTAQPNEEDLSFLSTSVQVTRGRSFSTVTQPKVESIGGKSSGSSSRKKSEPNGGGAGGGAGGGGNRRGNNNHNVKTTKDLASPSEEFFLDVILQRQARRLVAEHRLSSLGYFAAHLDFRLVEWLQRERESAAKIDNFVAALKHLHADFAWPYPTLSQPSDDHFLRRKSSILSFNLEEKYGKFGKHGVKSTDTNSAVGDSGYMSQDHFPMKQQEAHLQPHVFADTRSVISESDCPAWWGDEQESCSMDSWNDIPSVYILEQLSNEVTSRGSHKADVQLRYLLQIFMEAGCLDWCLVVSVMLRDVLAIHRVINAARSPDQGYEAVLRLRQGFVSLLEWSKSECLAYKPLMVACQSQATILDRLLRTKQRNVTPPPSSATATATTTGSTSGGSSGNRSRRCSFNTVGDASQSGGSALHSANSSGTDLPSFLANDGGEIMKGEDAISVASQKSSSSCIVS